MTKKIVSLFSIFVFALSVFGIVTVNAGSPVQQKAKFPYSVCQLLLQYPTWRNIILYYNHCNYSNSSSWTSSSSSSSFTSTSSSMTSSSATSSSVTSSNSSSIVNSVPVSSFGSSSLPTLSSSSSVPN